MFSTGLFLNRAVLYCNPRCKILQYCFLRLSSDTSSQVFPGKKDIYNGLTINTSEVKCEKNSFLSGLKESLNVWQSEGKRCIWFKVNIKDSDCVPILAKNGFNFHHARDDYVMMYRWLPGDAPSLPPACYTNLGVGAIVLNDKQQMLAVSEKHYDYPHWKLPGGYVEKGEDIVDAAVREVKEETGVDCAFQSLVTFRHTHKMMYGNSDIYVILLMKSLSDDISISNREVRECKWMKTEEYLTHPHVHEFNKLVMKNALHYKEKKIKLDIQKKTVKFSTYTRDMNFLILKEGDYK